MNFSTTNTLLKLTLVLSALYQGVSATLDMASTSQATLESSAQRSLDREAAQLDAANGKYTNVGEEWASDVASKTKENERGTQTGSTFSPSIRRDSLCVAKANARWEKQTPQPQKSGRTRVRIDETSNQRSTFDPEDIPADEKLEQLSQRQYAELRRSIALAKLNGFWKSGGNKTVADFCFVPGTMDMKPELSLPVNKQSLDWCIKEVGVSKKIHSDLKAQVARCDAQIAELPKAEMRAATEHAAKEELLRLMKAMSSEGPLDALKLCEPVDDITMTSHDKKLLRLLAAHSWGSKGPVQSMAVLLARAPLKGPVQHELLTPGVAKLLPQCQAVAVHANQPQVMLMCEALPVHTAQICLPSAASLTKRQKTQEEVDAMEVICGPRGPQTAVHENAMVVEPVASERFQLDRSDTESSSEEDLYS